MAKKKSNRRADYQAPTQSKSVPKHPAKPTKSVPARPSGRAQGGSNLSWWLLGGGIVGVVALVIVLSSVLGRDDSTGVTTATGWDLPALVAENDPDGDGRITLAEFQGKPVVLNFFASWCVACDRELPSFRQAVDDFEGEVQILFINSNETGDWRPMVDRGGIDDQILIDDIGGSRNNGVYRSLGGTNGMPLTAFYDADGNIAEVVPGELSADQIYSRIQALLESA